MSSEFLFFKLEECAALKCLQFKDQHQWDSLDISSLMCVYKQFVQVKFWVKVEFKKQTKKKNLFPIHSVVQV